jgi:hypothetical protein
VHVCSGPAGPQGDKGEKGDTGSGEPGPQGEPQLGILEQNKCVVAHTQGLVSA